MVRLYLLIVIIVFGFTQYPKHSKYITYSQIIQEGQKCILDGDFLLAKKKYKNAISSIPDPLASDCFTAIQLCAYTKDRINFKKLLSTSNKIGLTSENLLQDSLIKRFVASNDLQGYLSMVSKTSSTYQLGSVEKFLLDTINELSYHDNKWKVYYLDSLAQVDPIHKQLYHKKYDSIVKELVEEQLIPIIKKFGYPGERTLGSHKIGQQSDPYNYTFSNNRALFILLHYYSSPRDCGFNDLFFDQVKSGKMKPQEYASIMDFQAKYGDGSSCEPTYYNQWWTTDEQDKFPEINLRRANIGLGIFQDEVRKYERGKNACHQYDRKKYEQIKMFYWCG